MESEDFVSSFLRYTASSEAPKIFRKWVAIGMVASCLGRRVWTTTTDPNSPFFPNLFILLVGEPGVGKSLQLGNARKLMKELEDHYDLVKVGPDQITPESLAEELGQLNSQPDREDKDSVPEEQDADMALFLNEFGNFVKADSANFTDHITFLSGLYDCPDFYSKKTKTAGDDFIIRPCLNMVASTQPSWIGQAFDRMSLGQGFPARLMLVYSDNRKRNRPFRGYPNEDGLRKDLLSKLSEVAHLNGMMTWSEEAQEYYADLYEEDVPPKPTEPLLASYNERRGFYLAKLSMISAANDGARMVINKQHVEQALSWMTEIEEDMPKALLSAGGNKERGIEATLLKELAQYRKFSEAFLHKVLSRYVEPWRRRQYVTSLEDEGMLCRIANSDQFQLTKDARKELGYGNES